MRDTLPATEDLETFLAISAHGSLSAAARELGQPKSTLSRRLSRLEEALDAPLFIRSRHSLALSEAGHALLEPAREAIEALQALKRAAEQRRSEPVGRLRVSIPLDLLGDRALWLDFAQAHPRVALELVPTNHHVDLITERLDLAVRGGRGEDETLISQPLGSYDLIAVASPAHLARWGKLETPGELRARSCLLFKAMRHRPGYPDHPELPHRHIICPDEATALDGARRGLGVAILRANLVREDLARGTLAPALDAYNPLRIPVYAVYPARAYLRPAVVALMEHLRAALGESA